MTTSPTIKCPNCCTKIPLNEALTGDTRKRLEAHMRKVLHKKKIKEIFSFS